MVRAGRSIVYLTEAYVARCLTVKLLTDVAEVGLRPGQVIELHHSQFDDFVFPRVEPRPLRVEKNAGLRAFVDGWREGRPGHQTSQDTVVRRSAQRLGHCGQAGTVLKHCSSKSPAAIRPMPTETIAHDSHAVACLAVRNLRIWRTPHAPSRLRSDHPQEPGLGIYRWSFPS
jgi:hypothetical protein